MTEKDYTPFQVWLLASRPKTLPAAMSPVLIGTAMAYADGGFHLWSALGALAASLLIQIATNFFNDYADFKKGADTEERQGPLRVCQAGLVKPGVMLTASMITFALFAGCAAYLAIRGGWPIVILGIAAILSGIAYTAGPVPLAYVGLGDLFVFLFFGLAAVGGTYFVQTMTITPQVLVAGIGPGLLSMAILAVNNLRDADGDAKAGKKTLAVRFGKAFARAEYMVCIGLAGLMPVVLTIWTGGHWFALMALLIIPISMQAIVRVRTSTQGKMLNPVLAYTGKMLLLYSSLFSIGWVL